MIGLLFIAAVGFYLIIYRSPSEKITADAAKIINSIERYWNMAQQSIRDNKLLRAEKALLTILRVDEKNANAYNRLGIIYAKQDKAKEAIECFEIAQSLEPSAANLHNIGLIFYNDKNYVKAAEAFEQSLAIEDDVAVRYVAYAKVQEKLGDYHKMTSLLEKAVSIDSNPQMLKLLANSYERIGQDDLAQGLRVKSEKMIANQLKQKQDQQRKAKQTAKKSLKTKRSQKRKSKLIS